MGYLERSLTKDERVLHIGSIHWIVHLGPALLLLIGLINLVAGVSSGSIGGIWIVVGIVITIVATFSIMTSIIRRFTTDLAGTNKKIVAKWGLISRRTIEQRLEKIDSIQVDQGVLGRLLGYGTIIVNGSGASLTPIKAVRDPLTFRRQVEAAAEASLRRES